MFLETLPFASIVRIINLIVPFSDLIPITVLLITDTMTPMHFNRLTEDNFLLYATKCYENPDFQSSAEFNKDLKILVYVKKLLRRYVKSNEIKERLVLNHIITLANLFGPNATSRMLFFYCTPETFSALKTLLVFLDYMPVEIPEIFNHNVEIDQNLVSILRPIAKA